MFCEVFAAQAPQSSAYQSFLTRPLVPAGFGVCASRSRYNPCRGDARESTPRKGINLTVGCSLSRKPPLGALRARFIPPPGVQPHLRACFSARATPTVSTASGAAAPWGVGATQKSRSVGLHHGGPRSSRPWSELEIPSLKTRQRGL